MKIIYKILDDKMDDPLELITNYCGNYENVFWEYNTKEEAIEAIEEYYKTNRYCEDLIIVEFYRQG